MKLKKEWLYDVELVKVIDGDTYVFSVDVGFDIYPHVTVRIIGAYCPEIKGKEKAEGFAVKSRVEEIFSDTKHIQIFTEKDKSFDRYLAKVIIDGQDLAQHLVAKGYALDKPRQIII